MVSVFWICRVRFRNYIPKDDGLKEKMDNVIVNEKPLDYESDLKASSTMPGVDSTSIEWLVAEWWDQSCSKKAELGPKKRNWTQNGEIGERDSESDDSNAKFFFTIHLMHRREDWSWRKWFGRRVKIVVTVVVSFNLFVSSSVLLFPRDFNSEQ